MSLELVHTKCAAHCLSCSVLRSTNTSQTTFAGNLLLCTPSCLVFDWRQVLGAGIVDGRSPWAFEPTKVVSLVQEIASAVMKGNPNGKEEDVDGAKRSVPCFDASSLANVFSVVVVVVVVADAGGILVLCPPNHASMSPTHTLSQQLLPPCWGQLRSMF